MIIQGAVTEENGGGIVAMCRLHRVNRRRALLQWHKDGANEAITYHGHFRSYKKYV